MKKLLYRINFKLFLTAILFTGLNVHAQDTDLQKRDITLKVVNKRGRPVSKIVVYSLNTDNGGITDRSGLFVFRDMADSDTISLSLPKYGNTLIAVAGMDSIVVTLRSSSDYAYNDVSGQSIYIKRDRSTQSSNTLDVQALLKQSTYNSLNDLLRGKVPGLTVSSSKSGMNNASANIRGRNSIMFETGPLVVLDGIALGSINVANSIVDIQNIKTIEILKDGTGWGSRGAGGVILINTK